MYPQTLKTLLGAGLVVLLANGSAHAQSEKLKPKQPEPAPAAKAPAAESKTAGLSGSPQDPGPALKGVVIVGSRDEVKTKGNVTADGVIVGPGSQLDLMRSIEFKAMIQPLLGQPINAYNIGRLQREIIMFYRKNAHPLVDVLLPDQESVGNGVLQVFVLEGKLGKVTVEGNKYYKSSLFTDTVRLRAGDTINGEKLLSDIDWMNRNPGRFVDVAFRQGEKVGESDVVLRVKERYPLRGFVGYENTGARLAGEDRLFAGFNWFNAFGLDHRLSYQYTTDTDFDLLHAHNITYEIPLPWRHTLSFYGGYADSKADLPAPLSLRGSSLQMSGRYEIPLGRIGNFSHLMNFGLDFKRLDNTLEFGGFPVFGGNLDIFQIAAQYRTECIDSWGTTALKLDGYFSPGGITQNNSDAAFQTYRGAPASASYAYTKVTLERMTKLPADFSWVFRAAGQVSSKNLPTSEQLGLGGSLGPRGYDEREANGDNGYVLINELQTPNLPLFSMIDKKAGDQLKLLAFLDYGEVQYVDVLASQDPHVQLMSVGVGLRYQFRTNLSVRFDYGWQLTDTGPLVPHSPDNSRGHISAVLSF